MQAPNYLEIANTEEKTLRPETTPSQLVYREKTGGPKNTATVLPSTNCQAAERESENRSRKRGLTLTPQDNKHGPSKRLPPSPLLKKPPRPSRLTINQIIRSSEAKGNRGSATPPLLAGNCSPTLRYGEMPGQARIPEPYATSVGESSPSKQSPELVAQGHAESKAPGALEEPQDTQYKTHGHNSIVPFESSTTQAIDTSLMEVSGLTEHYDSFLPTFEATPDKDIGKNPPNNVLLWAARSTTSSLISSIPGTDIETSEIQATKMIRESHDCSSSRIHASSPSIGPGTIPLRIAHNQTTETLAIDVPNSRGSGIYVDEENDDVDSAFSDGELSTGSITSDMVSCEWKYGHSYHDSKRYILPNDETEQERLDLIHNACCFALNGLFIAPIDLSTCHILDIGTGTGRWAIEIADLYPNASVIGSDISVVPTTMVPVNLRFLWMDIEEGWNEPIPYDYIHCRYLAGSIENWCLLIQKVYQNLKPGGWAEFQEFDHTPYLMDGSVMMQNPIVQLMDGLKEAGSKIGRTMDPLSSLKVLAEKVGFVSVEEKCIHLPMFCRKTGEKVTHENSFAESFVRGVGCLTAVPFQDILGWSKEEVEVLNGQVRWTISNTDIVPVFHFITIIGKRPST